MTTLPTNKGRKFPAEPLTPDEVRALIDAASRYSSSGIRLRGLIGVMYGSGARIGEALALTPKDVDTGRGTVRILNGKNGKSRTVGLDPRSCELIDCWLGRRATYGLNGRHPIFATYEQGKIRSSYGRPLNPIYVRRTLANLGVKAKIEKRVHPHGLRHSLAFDMAQRGVPLHVIQRQLGHADLGITSAYLRRIDNTEIIHAVHERPAPMIPASTRLATRR